MVGYKSRSDGQLLFFPFEQFVRPVNGHETNSGGRPDESPPVRRSPLI